MRSEAPGLLPVLRSRHQADLLTLLLLHPEVEYTISELARRLEIPQSTVSGEVARLIDAGILSGRSVGRARLIRAEPGSPLVAPLTELLILTFGPHVVIAEEFAALDQVQLVVIFGSWAARYHGERGRPPNDIDVLVVGAPDRIQMYAAAERAEQRLDRRVNPTSCPPKQWQEPTSPLIEQVRARPYLVVLDRDRDAAGTPGGREGGAA
jgi:DNA-binding transcriptional ArsR family regulator